MRIFKNVHKALFTVAFASLALGFTACSDDDDDKSDNNPLALEAEMGLFGTYAGDLDAAEVPVDPEAREEAEEPTPELPSLRLVVSENHEMKMESYPISDLVYSLYETTEEADLVLAEIKTVSPKITFDSKNINKEAGTMGLDIDAEDVKVTLESGDVIEFDFDDNDQLGQFDNKEKESIRFTLAVKAELTKKVTEETRDAEPNKTATADHKFSFEKLTK